MHALSEHVLFTDWNCKDANRNEVHEQSNGLDYKAIELEHQS